MTLGRYFGWSSLAIATLAIAVLPDVLSLPEPDHAIVLDHAIYQSGNDDGKPVSLPHATRISELPRSSFDGALPDGSPLFDDAG